MEHWQLAYLGVRHVPRDLNEFELATFSTCRPEMRATFWIA
jgi:hypothetical protein